METLAKTSGLVMLILSMVFRTAAAEGSPATVALAAPPPSAPPQRSMAELEKLAMPIALHPDALVATILPAAVYPLEIVEAARFVKDTNNIPKIDDQPWDSNVKAVAKLPTLIQKMDADLSWTIQLGQAFLAQPKELMDAIQALRVKAQKAGTLQTTAQQVVVVTNLVVTQTNVLVSSAAPQVVRVTNTVVQIQPANPAVVYVPIYPVTVYYPPPPTYVGPPPAVTFAAGVAVGAVIANNCDWHYGGVYIGGGSVVIWGGGGYHPPPPPGPPPPGPPPPGPRPPGPQPPAPAPPGPQPPAPAPPGPQPPPPTASGSKPTGTAPASPSSGGAAPASAGQQKWQPDQNRLSASGAAGPPASAQARGWSSPAGQTTSPAQTGASAYRSAPTSSSARPASPPAPSSQPALGSSGSHAYNPSRGVERESAFGSLEDRSATHSYSQRGSFSRGGGGRRR